MSFVAWCPTPSSVHDDLAHTAAWRNGRTYRYERWVADQRRSATQSGARRHPALVEVETWLVRHYRVRFSGVVLSEYRHAREGLGFHRDRAMTWLDDTLVALLSLGAQRPWLMRPDTGRPVDRPRRCAARCHRPGTGQRRPAGDGRPLPAQLAARRAHGGHAGHQPHLGPVAMDVAAGRARHRAHVRATPASTPAPPPADRVCPVGTLSATAVSGPASGAVGQGSTRRADFGDDRHRDAGVGVRARRGAAGRRRRQPVLQRRAPRRRAPPPARRHDRHGRAQASRCGWHRPACRRRPGHLRPQHLSRARRRDPSGVRARCAGAERPVRRCCRPGRVRHDALRPVLDGRPTHHGRVLADRHRRHGDRAVRRCVAHQRHRRVARWLAAVPRRHHAGRVGARLRRWSGQQPPAARAPGRPAARRSRRRRGRHRVGRRRVGIGSGSRLLARRRRGGPRARCRRAW